MKLWVEANFCKIQLFQVKPKVLPTMTHHHFINILMRLAGTVTTKYMSNIPRETKHNEICNENGSKRILHM